MEVTPERVLQLEEEEDGDTGGREKRKRRGQFTGGDPEIRTLAPNPPSNRTLALMSFPFRSFPRSSSSSHLASYSPRKLCTCLFFAWTDAHKVRRPAMTSEPMTCQFFLTEAVCSKSTSYHAFGRNAQQTKVISSEKVLYRLVGSSQWLEAEGNESQGEARWPECIYGDPRCRSL